MPLIGDAPQLRAVREAFAGYPGSFWVAGGWAVGLHVGRVRRDHTDVDVLILARDLPLFDEVYGPDGLIVRDQQTEAESAWRYPQEIIAGRHTLYFANAPDPNAIEIVVALADGDDWLFHRGRGTRRPLAAISQVSADDIAYLGPEVVLLLKARGGRAKDDADFADLLPFLTAEQKRWLIPRLTPPGHPDHRWLPRLTSEV